MNTSRTSSLPASSGTHLPVVAGAEANLAPDLPLTPLCKDVPILTQEMAEIMITNRTECIPPEAMEALSESMDMRAAVLERSTD